MWAARRRVLGALLVNAKNVRDSTIWYNIPPSFLFSLSLSLSLFFSFFSIPTYIHVRDFPRVKKNDNVPESLPGEFMYALYTYSPTALGLFPLDPFYISPSFTLRLLDHPTTFSPDYFYYDFFLMTPIVEPLAD